MKNNIICILHTCIYSEHDNNHNNRIQQYINGISKFFEKKEIYEDNNIDFVLIDNNIENNMDLPSTIQNVIPDYVKIITLKNNTNGKINKGAGLIDNWIYCKNIIDKYNWVIHFEPRQLLINHDFIINAINNPRNLFTYCNNNKSFNTGLFFINSINLIDYINSTNLSAMVKNKISIEDSLYEFFENSNIYYDIANKLNLYWHDHYVNKQLVL